MAGTVVLSHGYCSSPESIKTTAMAEVAQAHGWQVVVMDYRDLDALGHAACVAPRRQRLVDRAARCEGPLLLAGSSMGAFASAQASCELPACVGLFLLALPAAIPDARSAVVMRADIPVTLVHGSADEVCPLLPLVTLTEQYRARLMVVPDGHRLSEHVEWIARQFGLWLEELERAGHGA